jgi:hypothetical protein
MVDLGGKERCDSEVVEGVEEIAPCMFELNTVLQLLLQLGVVERSMTAILSDVANRAFMDRAPGDCIDLVTGRHRAAQSYNTLKLNRPLSGGRGQVICDLCGYLSMYLCGYLSMDLSASACYRNCYHSATKSGIFCLYGSTWIETMPYESTTLIPAS